MVTPTVKSIEDQFFDAIGRVSAQNEYDPEKVLKLIENEFGNFEYEVEADKKTKKVRANVVDDGTKSDLLSLVLLLKAARADGKPIRIEDMPLALGQIATAVSEKLKKSLSAHKYGTPTSVDQLEDNLAKVERMYDRHFPTVYQRGRQG